VNGSPYLIKLYKFFFSSCHPDRRWGPSNFLFSGYRSSLPGAERPGREVGYSPRSSAEVENEWSYTSASHLCLHGVDRCDFAFVSYSRYVTSSDTDAI
jgi:hypothetical protein